MNRNYQRSGKQGRRILKEKKNNCIVVLRVFFAGREREFLELWVLWREGLGIMGSEGEYWGLWRGDVGCGVLGRVLVWV